MDPQRGLIEVKPCGNAHGETPKSFTFDAVYDWKYVVCLFLTQLNEINVSVHAVLSYLS